MSQYDSAIFYSRKHLIIDGGGSGLSVAGTIASTADIYRVVLTEPVTVDEMAVMCNTGGTAAGPVIVMSTSLAGTGALAPIGTFTSGTTANATALAAPTIASTVLSKGDHLVLQKQAGTAAATPVFTICIGYKTNLQ